MRDRRPNSGRCAVAASAFLAATIGGTGVAGAGGFLSARFGGEHGNVTTSDPTAIYYNPAGLALDSGTHLHVEGVFAYRSATYDRPVEAVDNVVPAGDGVGGTPDDAVGANAGRATLANMVASPFIGAVSDLGVDNLGVGVALFAPFGGISSWDRNQQYAGNSSFPGAIDGVQRWSSIEGEIRSLYLATGVAYRIPSARLAVGGAFNVVRNNLETLRARSALGTDDLVSGTGGVLEGRTLTEASGTTMSIALGVNWQPVDRAWIGVSYQSQPGFGPTTQNGTITARFGGSAESSTEIEFIQELPDVIRAGVRVLATPTLELRLTGDYARWSVFETQCLLDRNAEGRHCSVNDDGSTAEDAVGVVQSVSRNWQDTFGARVGASYWVRPTIEVNGGVAYDGNAIPDETLDASFIDMDKFLLSLGGRFRIAERLSIATTYTHVIYSDREVAMRPPLSLPSRTPAGAGHYQQSVGVASLGVDIAF